MNNDLIRNQGFDPEKCLMFAMPLSFRIDAKPGKKKPAFKKQLHKRTEFYKVKSNMKTNLFASLLMLALFVNAIGAAVLSFQYVRVTKQVQRLQFERVVVNRELGVFQAMLGDAMEYSKKNPKIDPLLRSIGLKPKTGLPDNTVQPFAK